MTPSPLNAQIAASRERLRELLKQKATIDYARSLGRKARNVEILRLFDDDGMSSIEIGRVLGLSDGLVRQFLHSRGRTKRGREAVKSQIAIMQETAK